MTMPSFYVSQDGSIQHSENADLLFGYSASDLEGKSIECVFSKLYRDYTTCVSRIEESGVLLGPDFFKENWTFKNFDLLVGKTFLVEGQHKDSELEPFPIRISISILELGCPFYMVNVEEYKESGTSLTLDSNGNIKSSTGTKEMFGYDGDYVKTQSLSLLFPTDIQENKQPPLLEPTSDVVVRNLIGQHQNGSKFYCTMQLRSRALGTFTLFMGTFATLDQSMEALILSDQNEKILTYSQNFFTSLFGYKKGELLGQTMQSFISRKRTANPSKRRKRKTREEGEVPNGKKSTENGKGKNTETPQAPAAPTQTQQAPADPTQIQQAPAAPTQTQQATEATTQTTQAPATPTQTQQVPVAKTQTPQAAAPKYHSDTSGALRMKHKDGSELPINLEVFPFQKDGQWQFFMKIRRIPIPESKREQEKKEEKAKELGHYLLLEHIGVGTSGKVRRAKNTKTGDFVAIKMIQKRKLDEIEIERTKREVEILRRFNHENIIKLYDVIETESNLNIVMELIDGEGTDLENYLSKRGKISEEECKELFGQILAAIYQCHADNIVHRDIKLKNIMITGDKKIKLIDFGVSNFLSAGKLNATFAGTPAYAAPEMLKGKEYVGRLIDVWSLGVVFYRMLTGKDPFSDLAQVLIGKYTVPEGRSESCVDCLSKMLVVEPDQRARLSDVMTHPWIREKTLRSLASQNDSDLKQPEQSKSWTGNTLVEDKTA